MTSILVLSGLFWQAETMGTIKPVFFYAKANHGGGLRAAATYHANQGVSVE